MSIQTSGTPYDQRQRLTADQVREATFERVPLGRRGLDETEVHALLDRVAEELEARDAELTRLLDENRRLKHAVRDWHRRQEGYDPAELLARAQQQVDTQIAQAEEYSREREEEATRLYEQILNEARERARLEAGPAVRRARGADGGNGRGDNGHRHLDRDRNEAYVTGLLQALDALASHVDATRQAFTLEVGKLDGGSAPDSPSTLAAPAAPTGTAASAEPAESPPEPEPEPSTDDAEPDSPGS